jgi:hypothetical protein
MTLQRIAVVASILLLAGCPGERTEEDPIDRIDAPQVGVPAVPDAVPPVATGDDQLPAIRTIVPAVPVPQGVPTPVEYAMLSDVPGPGVRMIEVETPEDPRQLAERFNRELAASGMDHEPLREVGRDEARFTVGGTVRTPEGRVGIGIRELQPGEAREEGGRAWVNYRIPTGRN